MTMSDNDIQKELFDASVEGDDSRVRELLAAGGNPNKYVDEEGVPALHWVTLRGHDDVLSTLIKSGADLNIQGKWGETAVHRAVVNRDCSILATLIRAGADLNLKNLNGQTALFWAVERGYRRVEVTTALLRGGADPNIQDNDGETALILAARSSHTELMMILLTAGADPDIENKDGDTAHSWAEDKKIARLEYKYY